MTRSRVLFLYPHESSFVLTDRDILSSFSEVRPLHYRGLVDAAPLVRFLTLSHLTFSWFALGHAFLATKLGTMTGRSSVVVAGGWDVCRVPELDYGYTLDKRRLDQVQNTLSRATLVLAVSEHVQGEIRNLASEAETRVLPLGFDATFFEPRQGLARKRSVLTVASVGQGTIKLKGLDTIAAAAVKAKDVEFTIVGDTRDQAGIAFVEGLPENVRVAHTVPPRQLLRYYQEAAVYVQLSAHESFGAALAEAMLCECNVVVTDRGAIPEVAGDAASYVSYGDVDRTVDAVYAALDRAPNERGRQRIATQFPLRAREAGLRAVVSECM